MDRWLVERWPLLVGLVLIGINWGWHRNQIAGLEKDMAGLEKRVDELAAGKAEIAAMSGRLHEISGSIDALRAYLINARPSPRHGR